MFSIYPTKVQIIPETTKEKRRKLTFHSVISLPSGFSGCITFRDARQKPLTSCDLLRGEKPIRDGHSSLPCAHGNHACSRGGDCVAEMFFSLFFIFILLLLLNFGLQKYALISNYASFLVIFNV